jgi:glycerophosphoryl diester phosphodiesterase
VFAHRGSSGYAPENTLAAFKLAIEQGADGIELDAKLTADGQVAVMHDLTVDRTTNGTGFVNAMTLPELKRLDAGSKFDPAFKSEPIPTLAEVFEAVGNRIVINVEVTNYAAPFDDLPDRIIAIISKYHLEDSVILSSFNLMALTRARALLPTIPAGLLTFKGFARPALSSRLIRFGPNFGIHPNYEDVTPELVDAAHKTGCRMHTFTVNQPEDMRQMFLAGVDGLFTRDPIHARNILAEINA